MSAYPSRYNPFAEDDDDEERGFGRPQAGGAASEDGWSDAAERQRSLRQQALSSARRAVQSSDRCVALVYESEQVGADTAEELLRQGDALRRTDKMLDKMDQDLKVSQRHINSIKSIFGGITNYFKSRNSEPQASPEPEKQTRSKLQESLDKSKQQDENYQANHPNLRKLDTSGFGATSSSAAENNNYPKNNYLRACHEQMDNNLDLMSSGLGRLKGLAIGLQTEIDEQDEIIHRLTAKTERVESKIGATDRQIRKL
ncbi:synaptosomal-associated protein 29 [Pristis pectinata]|uniref:synaptosomal-associated protein 29 n=1 Tax=Pristis pectinata TaxID=685728 RepID=UPI00223DF22E|nr:synaptosomal-associated protein 29 [Pristis pectinata]